MKEKRIFYLVYKTTNNINQKIYIGVHATYDIDDGYLGSGTAITNAIKKYGKDNFTREIIKFCESKEEMLELEAVLVDDYFVSREDTYNLRNGGGAYSNLGKVIVADIDGNLVSVEKDSERIFTGELSRENIPPKSKLTLKNKDGDIFTNVSRDDPRYLRGDLVGIHKGKVPVYNTNGKKAIQINVEDFDPTLHTYIMTNKVSVYDNVDNLTKNIDKEEYYNNKERYVAINTGKIPVKDADGNCFQVDTNDSRLLDGTLVTSMKGKVVAKDIEGTVYCVNKDDPRLVNGELVGVNTGFVTGLDHNGNTIRVKKTDPLLISGDFKTSTTGKVTVKDIHGNTFSVSTSDPRYLSGELVSNCTGKSTYKDKNGNRMNLRTDDPRVLSGEVVHVLKGMINIIDENGKSIMVEKDDPRILKNDGTIIIKSRSGKITVTDADGNSFLTSKDDPRIVSGELLPMFKGIYGYINNDGEKRKLSPTDPLVVSGEYRLINVKQMVFVMDKNGYTFKVKKNDPRLLYGELSLITHTPKDIIKVIDNNGNILKVHKNDIRYVLGEVVDIKIQRQR